jgi:hypothetical protein
VWFHYTASATGVEAAREQRFYLVGQVRIKVIPALCQGRGAGDKYVSLFPFSSCRGAQKEKKNW